MNALGNINMTDISRKYSLENIVQEYAKILNCIQYKFSKDINITKYSKAWCNKESSINLNTYHFSKSLEDWKKFKGIVKKTKHIFSIRKFKKLH